jgi:tetratricopeptide (TPR) repeat protein
MAVWLLASLAAGAAARAQTGTPGGPDVGPKPPTQPTREMTEEQAAKEKARLDKAITAAFTAKKYDEAEKLLNELIPIDHENFVPWYNLACALARQGKTDESVKMLEQAVARGYANIAHLRADDDLASIRETPGFKRIVNGWEQTLTKNAQQRIDRLKKRYMAAGAETSYRLVEDEAKKLAIFSAFEPKLLDEARRELDQLTAWWDELVLPEGDAAERRESKQATPTVTVLLPTRADYREWAQKKFGDGWDRIGGAYVHDERALVSMDLGATLRHEYWHVLHWRDMEARGQMHPIWVMEGLCSLPEDVEAGPKGGMIAKASWRTNIVLRLAKSHNLTPWDVMFAMDQKRFVGSRPLAFYAQGRAIFMWLHQQGKLRRWYSEFVDNWKDDRTGKLAFERVFGKPIREVEREFKKWARELPEVAEEVGRGRANLPVEVEPGQGDGVVVAMVPITDVLDLDRRVKRETGLKARDVISAIDGKAVRDFNDLARVLGTFEAGATVELDVRRRGQAVKVRVVLVPPKE